MKKTHESKGRSMIEMLGVLAIIGVLSIGGLSAFRSAMNSHKANNILDNISKLSFFIIDKHTMNPAFFQGINKLTAAQYNLEEIDSTDLSGLYRSGVGNVITICNIKSGVGSAVQKRYSDVCKIGGYCGDCETNDDDTKCCIVITNAEMNMKINAGQEGSYNTSPYLEE